MVCFSPDDRFLLSSAVDNEVREVCVPDGRVYITFDIQVPPRACHTYVIRDSDADTLQKRGSRQNYTRSYYMNGGEYIITGSCQESVVRVYNALTGQYHSEVNYATPEHGDTLICICPSAMAFFFFFFLSFELVIQNIELRVCC
jgi:WD40 repeat protein